ncbi:sulfatase-like hydrolase/transferase [uncultured Algibacter sp.]|uniref:sulfatase-like hydrolase/transferase n=1 Tax=uncultured Algibacter sp. TaxID=298659 RepID=UPI003217B1F6
MNRFFSTLFAFITLISLSCSKTDNDNGVIETVITNVDKPNIILILADDMGLDATPGYNTFGAVKPMMPNLQAMLNDGIKFTNLWAYAVCSPTRASIITGKYGFRTQVSKPGDDLSLNETSLQKYMANENTGYANAVIGKWHLSDDESHPNNLGVDYYAGMLSGGVRSYSSWDLVENGQTTTVNEYTTTKLTDLAINWIDNQSQPWFLWLAYNAPHTPFHLPPNDLHFQGDLPSDTASINANPIPYYMAMLEAMDTEMGRLFNSLSDQERANTIFVFVGDNGTPNRVVQSYPRQRAKNSIYQGGVNVPMVISGKNVERKNTEENAVINTTDLFATIANIAGVNVTEINDSKSFKPLLTSSSGAIRKYAYSDVTNNSGAIDYAVTDGIYKYIAFSDNTEALYNLIESPLESENLLDSTPLSIADSNAKSALSAELERIKNN